MPRTTNSPQSQSKPAPLYVNDTTGFWAANRRANDANWLDVLPVGTSLAADKEELNRIFRASLMWLTVTVRWDNIEFQASLDDGQAAMPLEMGGMGATGTITLVFSQSQFDPKNRPAQHHTVSIMAKGEWKNFTITSISEGFDESSDSLIATCEPEDASA
jgi:hypothetical protein